MRLRQNIYLDHDLHAALGRVAVRRDTTKSALVNEALAIWFAQCREPDSDILPESSPDALCREVAACRCDVELVLEALVLFVRYRFTVDTSPEEADINAIAVGNELFERFIVQLGRQFASGRRTRDAILSVRGEG